MSESPYTPEQVEALQREQAGYETRGMTDRAKLVAAELRKAGAPGDAPRGRRSARPDEQA